MSAERAPALSVVVATRDRAARLPALLDALDACALPEGGAELLVVDDGSRPAVSPAERGVLGRPVRWLRQRARGAAAARNLGARAARGPLLVLLADDLDPDPGLLVAHARAHEAREATGRCWAFLGPIEAPAVCRPFERWLWGADVHHADGAVRERWRARGELRPEHLQASNLSVPRARFLELGGFDEGFPGAAWEDVELGMRWTRAGGAIGLAPGARAVTSATGRTSLACYLAWKHDALPSAQRLLRCWPELEAVLTRPRAPRWLDRWSRIRALGALADRLDRAGVALPTALYASLTGALAPRRIAPPACEGPVRGGRIARDPLTGRVRFESRGSDSVLAGELLAEALIDFRDAVPAVGRVVEVGCGDGPLATLLGVGPDRYVGLDRSSAARAASLRADAGALPIGAGRAALVLCSEVLEHLPDPPRALREILALLEPGGALLVTTPFFYRMHDRPEDRWRFTEDGLRALLGGAGFRLERIRAVGGAVAVAADPICRSALPLTVRPLRALGERTGWRGLARVGAALEHRVSVASQRVFLALRRLALARLRAGGGGGRLARWVWDRGSRMSKGYVLLARPAQGGGA